MRWFCLIVRCNATVMLPLELSHWNLVRKISLWIWVAHSTCVFHWSEYLSSSPDVSPFFVFVQVKEAQGENLRHAFSVWWFRGSVLLWWFSELSLTESHFEETSLPDSEWGEGPNSLKLRCDRRPWFLTADCLCRCDSAVVGKVFKTPRLHRGKEELTPRVNVDQEGVNWWFQSKTSICLN